MSDDSQWLQQCLGHRIDQPLATDTDEDCTACSTDLVDLTFETDTQQEERDHTQSDVVAETGFSLYVRASDSQSSHTGITVQGPSEASSFLDAVSRDWVAPLETMQTDRDDFLEQDDQDEDFDSPDMFEYENPGLHMEYTDTDVDLERSLDMHELLEIDHFSSDPLLSYRSDKFEDRRTITDADVQNGMDMQGIRWKRGLNARKDYRQYRVGTYENYFNSHGPYRGPVSRRSYTRPDRSFLRFVQNEIEFKCSLVHFQLRNLLCALNKNAVYHTDTSVVKLYNPQKHTCETIMDLTDKSVTYPFKISSLAMTDDYCCVGGFFGEYALKRLNNDGDADVHVGLVTTDMTGITNHICPQVKRSGGHQLTISSNDSCLRKMDVETLKLTQERFLDHPLNCSATSEDKRIQVVVGDHCSAMLLDAENGDVLKTIDGHTDYSFACAWSSDGYTFATGSQDLTTRLYDARGSMDNPLAIYRASIGAIRSLKFSECGRFLAVAEPADFVHLHDTRDLKQSQCIDFFGEISGIDFSGDSFFIGNADRVIGGIAEFEMCRESLGLDDMMF
ncbi:Putative uncharacterized protein [Taphrina deformans PYCC 5710]|uniref:Uncharacterized protein n=1 Tax=Taphrina deformans (strain PYCC 5710 / ATCC 11124 / CBS 356.35 / IMI 108563 / JCM 9778 / NBRC 8474) TaxID=1097556 RepID=R4X6Z2_TAPDE|nr:Putative uncharacterized protein [Taphrina deformans PYCC 5710]|eukprot:CCG81007.1 Putative uncharacterized protein [Taphrina deformans PYCC 5710]